MALLGYAGGGRLGNFGAVGVDQATFGPAAFLWFAGIGALTVAMSGGITRRVKAPKPEPEPQAEREPDPEPESDVGLEAEPDFGPEPELPSEVEAEAEPDVDEPQPDPESEVLGDDPEADPRPPAEPVGVFDDPEEHFVVDDFPDDQATPGTATDRARDRDD
jgi:hypothetical protein